MDKWIIIHLTHLLPNPFMTQPAHLPPLLWTNKRREKSRLIICTTLMLHLQKNSQN